MWNLGLQDYRKVTGQVMRSTRRPNYLWVVWYGTSWYGGGRPHVKDKARIVKWRALKEEYSGWRGARAIIDLIIRENHARQAFAVEAPTRYQAIKIAQGTSPKLLRRKQR